VQVLHGQQQSHILVSVWLVGFGRLPNKLSRCDIRVDF